MKEKFTYYTLEYFVSNELPKSDKHSDKVINQLNHCKTIADLCEFFHYLPYIFQEESLIYPSQGRRFIYDIKNDNIYNSTKVLSEDFRNLKIYVKCHFENEVHQKMNLIGKKRKIKKANVKHENMQSVCGSRDCVMQVT